ncbi:MAG: Do family serine endopeptidase [Pirellulales bacterium]
MKKVFFEHRWLAGMGLMGLLALGSAAVTSGSGKSHFLTAGLPTPVTHIAMNTAPAINSDQAERAVASAKDLSTAFRVASDRVLPSLVTIETTVKAPAMAESPMKPHGPKDGENPFRGTPFEDFFKDAPLGQGFKFESPQGPQPPQHGTGSGVVIDKSGLIMTNNHVVAGGTPEDILVRLSDGREFQATDVWTDPKTDIAIVKIKADGLTPAKIGDSDQVSVGDWVLALGQPFGLESTVTAGIISAKHRGVGIAARESFLQTDAAINPGNSGGPLVNLDGEVIGINTAISSRNGGNDGVGFAVPINMANWVGNQLAHGGVVKRAYLGVGIQPVTASIASQFHVKPREGVVVTDVYPDTPAAKAGLQSGDVIVEYAGVKVTSPQELQVVVEKSELGRPHVLNVMRDGKPMTLNFTPEEQPESFGRGKPSAEEKSEEKAPAVLNSVGLELSNLDQAVAEKLNMKGTDGVVITDVQAGSLAATAGLESGMVITQVQRQPVKSVEECQKLMQQADLDEGLLLLVKTHQGSRFVILKK